MYSIYIKNNSNEVCIYNDAYISDERQVSSPKLDLIENNAGTLSFKLPPTNIGYDKIERLSTEVIVKKKGKELWSGRVLTIKEDFYKNKTYTCEGELAYLNDTTQEQEEYENINTYNYFRSLLENHNNKVGSNKKFTIGSIGIADTYDSIYTNFDTTFKYISDAINNLDGYIQIRKENGVRYLDTVSEENRPISSQEIRFGKNLLDFTKSFDSTDFCTVVLPLGARLQNSYGISMSGIEGVDAYTTVEDVNNGSLYVVNSETVDIFGWIEKVVNFNDIDDEEELLEEAKKYLSELQFDNMVLEANAVDLGYLGINAETIQLSEKVRVISQPHGLDRYFPVIKISIPLDNPANTSFTMGTTVTQKMSSQMASGSNYITTQIKNTLSDSSLLTIARTNANALINSFSTGYFTVTQKDNGSNEVYFTDTPISDGYDPENPAAEATRYWRWNLNGLGYYNKNAIKGNDKYKDPTDGLRLALTIDGAIVADYITAGTLDADVIRAGILKGISGDSYWNLSTGEFYLANNVKYGDGTLSSTFSVLNNAIVSEVTRASKSEESLSSKITQTADSIVSEVTRASKSEESLSTRISQNATSISTKVTSGDVESIIEQKADSIRLKSDKLVVNSNNFELTENGDMTCTNANIKGKLQTGNDTWVKIEGSNVSCSSGAHIDFNTSTENGGNTIQLYGNGFAFSTNYIYVASSEGSASGGVGRSGTIWYKGTNGNDYHLTFLKGICTDGDGLY